jgi:hypothetical protein
MSKQYILLNPITPEYFGYSPEDVGRMIDDMEDVDIKVLVVDTGKEVLFYACAMVIDILEDLCTCYNLEGVVVEAHALFDQRITVEVVR